MEREARKVQDKHYTGNMKEEVCLSNVMEEMDNKIQQGEHAQPRRPLRDAGLGDPQTHGFPWFTGILNKRIDT